MDEFQAIALLKQKNLAGLEPLIERYHLQAIRTSYLILQDADLAEDIVQIAYLQAAEKISQLRSPTFGGWFLKIVINLSIKAAIRQKRTTLLPSTEDEGIHSIQSWLLDPGPSPEEQVLATEQKTKVWQALTRLNPQERAAVVMKYFLEMSEAEITRELHSPLSTIKWRLYSAREKLRRSLTPAAEKMNPHSPASIPQPVDKEPQNENK